MMPFVEAVCASEMSVGAATTRSGTPKSATMGSMQ